MVDGFGMFGYEEGFLPISKLDLLDSYVGSKFLRKLNRAAEILKQANDHPDGTYTPQSREDHRALGLLRTKKSLKRRGAMVLLNPDEEDPNKKTYGITPEGRKLCRRLYSQEPPRDLNK